jgi:hypothetical protein
VNTKLLQDLKLAATPGNATVGQIFVQLAPFMKMYASYANNYESAARLLAEYRKTKPRFEEFCLECEADPRSRGLALGSFIIMPVQRIPRYKMLLAELVKYSEDIPDFATLEDALQKVSEVALEINESIRRYEKQQELIALDVRCEYFGVLTRLHAGLLVCACAQKGGGVGVLEKRKMPLKRRSAVLYKAACHVPCCLMPPFMLPSCIVAIALLIRYRFSTASRAAFLSSLLSSRFSSRALFSLPASSPHLLRRRLGTGQTSLCRRGI